MTKAELIENVHSSLEAQVSKTAVGEVYDKIFETITEALLKESRFAVHGFGTFEVRERKERQGRNPKTKEAITIPAQKSVGFKPASSLKTRVN
ncbi:MAG: HU family DNA-binding protein [Sumerlaeia bacterium]